jgi:hypothetical protein
MPRLETISRGFTIPEDYEQGDRRARRLPHDSGTFRRGAIFLAIGYGSSRVARFSSLLFYETSSQDESGIATNLKDQLRKLRLEVLIVVVVILVESGIILFLILAGSHSQNFPPFTPISTMAPSFLGPG